MDDARALPGVRIAKSLAVQALDLRPGHAVADVGCGPGEDTREMARRINPGGSVTGIDTSSIMLTEARARAAACGLPVTFRRGDAVNLPLPANSVDGVRADTLLQHVPDPAQAVTEMARITRPGGRIALTEFDLGTLAVDHPDRASTRQILSAVTAAAADGWAGRGLPGCWPPPGSPAPPCTPYSSNPATRSCAACSPPPCASSPNPARCPLMKSTAGSRPSPPPGTTATTPAARSSSPPPPHSHDPGGPWPPPLRALPTRKQEMLDPTVQA